MNKLSKFKIIEEAFLLIDKNGWEDFSLEKLALINNYKIEDLKNFIKNKNSILVEFSKMIDQKVEKNIDFQDFQNSNIKDNIFELVMTRFDVMTPFKRPLKKILLEIQNPLILQKISSNVFNSMDFYLEFSNAYENSIFDIFKKKSLFLIYAYCFRIWLDDNSEEQSKTMSELDRLLSVAENFSKRAREFCLF